MDHQDRPPRQKGLLGQILRFNLVGVFNTAVTYAFYALLVFVGVDPFPALIADYALGLVLGFLLNRALTFDAKPGTGWASFGRMVLSYLPLLGLNMALLFLFVRIWSWNEYGAQFVAQGLVAGLSFVVQKFFVFSHKGA